MASASAPHALLVLRSTNSITAICQPEVHIQAIWWKFVKNRIPPGADKASSTGAFGFTDVFAFHVGCKLGCVCVRGSARGCRHGPARLSLSGTLHSMPGVSRVALPGSSDPGAKRRCEATMRGARVVLSAANFPQPRRERISRRHHAALPSSSSTSCSPQYDAEPEAHKADPLCFCSASLLRGWDLDRYAG